MAVAAPRRRADRDEHRLGALDALGDVGGERRGGRRDVAGHELVEARLEYRDLAALQRGDLVCSLSTQVTVWPKSAKHAPETSPT